MKRRKFVGFDTETDLITELSPVPTPVCGSFCDISQSFTPWVVPATEIASSVRRYLEDESYTLAIHNARFDVGVSVSLDATLLPLWIRAAEQGRVWCSMIVQKVIDNKEGLLNFKGYKAGMAALFLRIFGDDLSAEKNDPSSYRMRYIQLLDIPLKHWPAAALKYAADDAQRHVKLALWQEEVLGALDDYTQMQIEGSIALKWMSMEGNQTDPEKVEDVSAVVLSEIAELMAPLRVAGLVRPNGSRDTKAIHEAVSKAYHGTPALTEKGRVSAARAVLEDSGNPTLVQLSRFNTQKKITSAYLKAFRRGSVRVESRDPEQFSPGAVYPTYWSMMATGRTSASKPGIQQTPRRYRGVYIADRDDPNIVLVGADYSQIELVVLAQVILDLLGWSRLAEIIISGVDGHVMLAQMLGFFDEYDPSNETHRTGRQTAKGANYALPGGLWKRGLVGYLRGWGIYIDETEAMRIINAHQTMLPDVHLYVEHARAETERGRHVLYLPRINFTRKTEFYTDYSNTPFQAQALVGALRACIRVQKECYLGSGVLSDYVGWAFMHDEIIIKGPRQHAEEALHRLQTIMVEEMQPLVPALPVSTDGYISRHWRK